MSNEEAFGMFWWYGMLEEEQEDEKQCPNCGSRRIRYDEDRDIWVCLDCDYEWRKNNDF